MRKKKLSMSVLLCELLTTLLFKLCLFPVDWSCWCQQHSHNICLVIVSRQTYRWYSKSLELKTVFTDCKIIKTKVKITAWNGNNNRSEAKINGSDYQHSRKHVQKSSAQVPLGVLNMEGFSLSNKPWILPILALVNWYKMEKGQG